MGPQTSPTPPTTGELVRAVLAACKARALAAAAQKSSDVAMREAEDGVRAAVLSCKPLVAQGDRVFSCDGFTVTVTKALLVSCVPIVAGEPV